MTFRDWFCPYCKTVIRLWQGGIAWCHGEACKQAHNELVDGKLSPVKMIVLVHGNTRAKFSITMDV